MLIPLQEWGPIRPLGAGGWGRVGLWQKRDNQNRIIDEVVCKEQTYRHDQLAQTYEIFHMNENEEPVMNRLTSEAVIQRDLNQQHPGVAPHLRGYKYILEDRATKSGRYRYYLEYCPHNSLNRIHRLYRCWDTYLPEVFLWHVFHSLAAGCEALRDPPLEDNKAVTVEDRQESREDMHCLHLDWKPDNVLLGYPQEGQLYEGHEYPSALMNDFGTSIYVTGLVTDAMINPKELWWRGTAVYMPTVSTICLSSAPL